MRSLRFYKNGTPDTRPRRGDWAGLGIASAFVVSGLSLLDPLPLLTYFAIALVFGIGFELGRGWDRPR